MAACRLALCLALGGLCESSTASAGVRAPRTQYRGRGPEQTTIAGLSDKAAIYHTEAEFSFAAAEYRWNPTRSESAATRFSSRFEQIVRAYARYSEYSTLIRVAYGHAVYPGEPVLSPQAFLRELVLARDIDGVPPLSSERLSEVLIGLLDGHSIHNGALSDCRQDIEQWLSKVADVSPRGDLGALRKRLGEIRGEELRRAVERAPTEGCEELGQRDYLYASYGVVSHTGKYWQVVATDYRAPWAETREVSFEQITGSSEYFKGSFSWEVTPESGSIEGRYSFDIDLSRFPDAIVRGYSEQLVTDLYKSWMGLVSADGS